MGHVTNLVLLGLFAGMISGFLTRITKPDMIFERFGNWMDRYNNKHILMFVESSKMIYALRCVFCMTPYIVVVFDVVYIAYFTPYWLFCVIGVPASIGAGNFVAEIICALRGGE